MTLVTEMPIATYRGVAEKTGKPSQEEKVKQGVERDPSFMSQCEVRGATQKCTQQNKRKIVNWLWVKNAYQEWNPAKWNQQLKSAAPLVVLL